ncbi:MAG TPA: protein kinase, partial [Gemmata sp.]|nr:protein kinase [Gemmata sp.]
MSAIKDPHADHENRLGEAVAWYFQAAEKGNPPNPADFFARYPELRSELESFLADKDVFNRAAGPRPDSDATLPPAPNPETAAYTPNGDPNATLPPSNPETASDNLLGSIRYFGDYELLAEIARGGMGVVFRARQVSLNREVALKMILTGQLASAADVARFRAEAEAAANLDHPNVLPIYEVGEHLGQQYFAMKLVPGGSLAGKVTELVKDPRKAVAVFVKVCRAVDFAHRRGILHRDLKPGNILLDGDGTPYVTDFGLAKKVEGDSNLTQSGAIVGTPSYMAPEQARADKGLTTGVDVYALGAILYELLTGKPPFRGPTVLDTILQVLEKEAADPRSLKPEADKDLSLIALKCLSKEPGKRYESASVMADDLERWHRGEPIAARATSPGERLLMWARRKPVLAGSIASVFLALTGLLIISGFLWRNAVLRAEAVQSLDQARLDLDRASQGREQAEKERVEATNLAAKIRTDVSQLQTQAETAKKDLDKTRVAAGLTQYAADIQLAHAAFQRNHSLGTRELLQRYAQPTGDDPRGFEFHYLWQLCHRERLGWQVDTRVDDSVDLIFGLAISPDGNTVATASKEGKIKFWNLKDGSELETIEAKQANVQDLAFSNSGKTVSALVSIRKPHWERITAAAAHKEPLDIRELTDHFEIRTWNRNDPRQPVTSSFDPLHPPSSISLMLKFVGSISVQHQGSILNVMSIAGSSDGNYLALGGVPYDKAMSGTGRVIIWDSGKSQVHSVRSAALPVTSVAFSKNRKLLAMGLSDGVVHVEELDSKKPPRFLRGHVGNVNDLCFNADDSQLVSAANDGSIFVWDLAAGKELTSIQGHAMPVVKLAIASDQRTLVSVAIAGDVKVWDLDREPNPRIIKGTNSSIEALAFTTKGDELISVDSNSAIAWRLSDGQRIKEIKNRVGSGAYPAISRDAATAAWFQGNSILVQGLTSEVSNRLSWNDRAGLFPTLSSDGKWVVASDQEFKDKQFHSGLAVWKVSEEKPVAKLGPLAGLLGGYGFTPDNSKVAYCYKGNIFLWDWQANTTRELFQTGGEITNMAFS